MGSSSGRQFFVICSVFVVAQVTTFNDMNYWPWTDEFWNPPATTTTPVPTTAGANVLNTTAGLTTSNLVVVTGDSNPEGLIPEWFRIAVLQTGVLGALVVVIIGQLVPQLVAVPCPILFFSLPGSHLILQIGLFFHYIGITYIAFLLTMIVLAVSSRRFLSLSLPTELVAKSWTLSVTSSPHWFSSAQFF